MIGAINHPYGEPNVTYTRNNGTRKPVKLKRKDYTKAKRVLKAKASAPGVPQNSCPYIDLAICTLKDLSEAYDKLHEKGNPTALVAETEKTGIDLMEHVRITNETLRESSKYWYDRYLEMNAEFQHLKQKHNRLRSK
jgi:hypothetical protein